MFTTRTYLRSLAFVAGLTSIAAPAWADTPFVGKTGKLTFAVNAEKSEFKFASDAPAERIRGTAKGISGGFTVADATKPETTSGQITVPVAKMQTGNPIRDGHLQGPDWLNTKVNPNVSFDIDKVDIRSAKAEGDKGTAEGTAHGSFTLNGVAKKLSFPVQISYLTASGALKVTTKFKVSLKDYNIKGKAGLVGSKVGEVIDVDATLYATAR